MTTVVGTEVYSHMPDPDHGVVMAPIRTGSKRFDDSYGLVLLLMTLAFLVTSLAESKAWRVVLILLLLAGVILTFRSAEPGRPISRFVYIAAPIAALAAIVDAVTTQDFASWPSMLLVAFILALGPVVILRDILVRHREVTLETILGALTVYVYLGMLAATGFAFIDAVLSEPFFAQGEVTDPGTYTYFSFVTLTTLGYGDLTPAVNLGRQLAVFEAVVGQVYLVTLVARLVSLFRTSRQPPPVDELRDASEQA